MLRYYRRQFRIPEPGRHIASRTDTRILPLVSRALLAAVLVFLISPSAGAQTPEDLIHLGDLVDVDVVGSTEFDWRGSLTPEGFLSGIQFTDEPVSALCRTPEQVADVIKGSYGKFLNAPEVRVSILDRSGRMPAVIFGAVRTQQRLKLLRPVRLAELIVLSGGLTSKASGEIKLLRQPRASCSLNAAAEPEDAVRVGDSVLITVMAKDLIAGDPEANPEIAYGDVITVLETSPVYVMGGVANPTRVDFRDDLTLSRAVASAGGPVKGADLSRVTIFRREGHESKVIKADLSKIGNGETDDIALSAYDIVDVGLEGEPERRYAPLDDVGGAKNSRTGDLPLRVID
ncbi:MAG TPA: SLBB domain-containing protein [Aridibacter sp.]|nr:SLBB domain-containing protein [Aridibacter sp.]